MDINTNFIAGKMNKSVDERLVPKGQYIDALNVRLGSTETTEIGAVENSKGNQQKSFLKYKNVVLSPNTKCIGAYADGINQVMYWFVHDPTCVNSNSGKVDMIVSLNTSTNALKYLVITETVLNFNPSFLITGVDLIDDLLFFTDNTNPPRVINIERDYPYPTSQDNITSEDILVIVKPPGFDEYVNNFVVPPEDKLVLAAPKLLLFNTPSLEENYIVDRFLCFAYRYKYKDGQYSATSLFTNAAFDPKPFQLDYSTLNNDGMENNFNTVSVTISTGGSDVVGVDILYKESGKNIIYLIEKYDKEQLGWSDNSERSINFGKKKIYTALGEDELGRTFDNVPKTAQAQTIQGNRVVYGNYVDGYNMVDDLGLPISVDYITDLISVNDRDQQLKNPTRISASQNWDISTTQFTSTLGFTSFYPNISIGGNPVFTPTSIFGSTVKRGTNFEWEIVIRTTGTESVNPGNIANFPATDDFKSASQAEPISLTFSFTANQDYNSVNSMLNSVQFSNAVGVSNFQPINNSSNGSTLTDLFNRSIIPFSSTYSGVVVGAGPFVDSTHELTGITSQTTSEGFALVITNDEFALKVPAVKYEYDDAITGSTGEYYEYFQFIINSMTGKVDSSPNKESLHSNRDYSLGIIYMDEFGRSSTVLTNENNTVHTSPLSAGTANSLQASIFNKPPGWATRYKFAIKPSDTTYDTIYVYQFYQDFNDPSLYWFRLIGEDQAIVEAGQRLIIKADSDIIFPELTILEVLEVESKARGTIDGTVGNPGSSLPGLYFSAKPSGWSPNTANSLDVNYNTISSKMKKVSCGTNPSTNQQVVYPLYATNSTGNFNYSIPPGSVIQLDMRITRDPYGGIWSGDPDRVKSVNWRWKQEYISNASYSNFYAWFNGQNISTDIQGTLDNGEIELDGRYVGTLAASQQDCNLGSPACYSYSLQFIQDPTSSPPGLFSLCLSHGVPRGGPAFDKRPANVSVDIRVITNSNVLVVETEPTDADPNIYYEDSENFQISINPSTQERVHNGNLQNQILAANQPAICALSFMNCYTFGNGVESYKILDNITGEAVSIGERVSAVSVLDYQESKRIASLTYSGIYSGATNLNNSNEFNLSLANFKDLELSFGPIMKLHARETDILVLQEDKISYVLSNKDLISDSSGTGQIIAVPEVLGKQIARIEEYGISYNPESFVSWGKDFYFTDTKRGAVIKLTGTSVKTDAIEVISTYGMRSYFRDSFSEQIDTQKLGGYDPYMDEYVLNNNPISVISTTNTADCGLIISQTNTNQTYSVDVTVGQVIGIFQLLYSVGSLSNPFDITITWQGTEYITPSTGTNTQGSGIQLIDTNADFTTDGVLVGDTVYNTTSGVTPYPRTSVAQILSSTALLLNSGIFPVTNETYSIIRDIFPTTKTVTGVTSNGTLSLNKRALFPQTINVTVSPTTAGDDITYDLTPKCIIAPTGNVTQIVLTSPQQAGQQVHYEYQWNNYSSAPQVADQFESPIESNLVVASSLTNQGVSAFTQNTGKLSLGMIPPSGADIILRSNKLNTDNLDFNVNENKFYIFTRSTDIFPPGTGNANDFKLSDLTAQAPRTPIANPQAGLFTVFRNNIIYTSVINNLILVTDLRDYSYVKMGYSDVDAATACSLTGNCSQMLTTVQYNTSSQACADVVITIPRYHNGISGQNIAVGDIVYQNSPCNSGSTNWTPAGFYGIAGSRVVQVGTDGLCINIINC
mgnify:CR=1 FL=1